MTTYVVVKGYSKDGRYLIVYDPVPSDWSSNSMRYADGISMIGRNRYYDAGEVVRALRGGEVLEILGSGPAPSADPSRK